MNKFFEYIQPTIVRASCDETLPERVRGRFFINFNVFGIRYFEENYILTETSNNYQYLLLKENAGMFQLENQLEALEAENIVDIPRIYIDITDKFVNDDTNLFKSFVFQASLENAIWAYGIENFVCGEDYYVNSTLYSYLALTDQLRVTDFGCRLPNYLDELGQRTKYWVDLSNEPYKNYADLEYFNEKNKLLSEHIYSEDELNNFYSTFCSLILDNTKISDSLLNSGNNPIYKLVLEYYKNFKTDSASNSISLILNTLYSNTTTNTTCSCNSNFKGETTYQTSTCYELYLEAMLTWLKTMLGDTAFYEDWFTIDNGTKEKMLNMVLLDKVKRFIEEFLDLQNTLSFTSSKKTYNCECPTISLDENTCNYNIIQNFLNILAFIYNKEIPKNKNKIKIYGEQFGELLPKLQF